MPLPLFFWGISALCWTGMCNAVGPSQNVGSGQIVTVAGTGEARLTGQAGHASRFPIASPFGVEVGPNDSLLITEVGNHRVLQLNLQTRHIKAVAGCGEIGLSGTGNSAKVGVATEAKLNEPYEVRWDRRGSLVFVEMKGAVVRRVDLKTGRIQTIAGTGEPGFAGDGGPAIKAKFRRPHSIALDEQGHIYVADIGNHRVRRIDQVTEQITTVLGTGQPRLPEDGALAAGQPIKGPRALCYADGQLFIALREGNSVWRLDLHSGRIHHVAGTSKRGQQDGPASKATFHGPKGIAVGPDHTLFVVDTENQAIRQIDLTKKLVTTVAGNGRRGFSGEGGPPSNAALDRPHGIACDALGRLYIGDTNNHRVRQIVLPKRKGS